MPSRIPNPIRRTARRFSEDPGSIGNAVRLIILVTAVVVLAGSAAIWLFDRHDFPDYGTALWFSLQTVTTVGYGEVTPQTVVGRVVTGIVMLVAIGFITVITAAITSTSSRRHSAAEGRRTRPRRSASTSGSKPAGRDHRAPGPDRSPARGGRQPVGRHGSGRGTNRSVITRATRPA